MPRPRWVLWGLACALCAGSSPAGAQVPSPITSELFPFPGSVRTAGSTASAAVALADRWLGDEPFDNPAVAPWRGAVLSPVLQRMSRQDLRAANRHFDEQGAFLDVAGGWMGNPIGNLGFALYGYQPVLRREENAFERGELGAPVQPAVIQSNSSARELRLGAGASAALGALRLGLAGEWTHRDDHYEATEQSGSPEEGTRRVEFSGDGFGFQVGARFDSPERNGQSAFAIGAQGRYVPELSLDGDQDFDILTGPEHHAISARREAGWEGGLSARYAVTPAFRVIAGAGGHTALAWHGFGVTSGEGFLWSGALEYHDARDPWTVRFGLGREAEDGVPELRAGVLGLGFGWRFEQSTLDVGVLRRSIDRGSSPTLFDDRVVASFGFEF